MTCQPLVSRELHKGSLNNNGRRSNLVKDYSLFTQRKFLIINYKVTHLFFNF